MGIICSNTLSTPSSSMKSTTPSAGSGGGNYIHVIASGGAAPKDITIHEASDDIQNTNYPPIYESHFSKLLIPHTLLQERTAQIASHIHNTYDHNEALLIICVLKGSSPFFHLLLQELSGLCHPYMIDFIKVKSYEGLNSSGTVQVGTAGGGGLPKSIQGRHVLIIEDIIDTGLTLSALIPKIKEEKPKSVKVCSMLVKRLGEKEETTDKLDHVLGTNESSGGCAGIDWNLIGFSIPDIFVVGCGLDFNEMYRDLMDLYILGPIGIEGGGYGEDV
uniref:Phosphoribosyltransferase domain-containing protein n=1 Tax=Chaetoceros debilis TaxID=122233 RepID=A0A7S3PZA6_9STRA|mmetsp:Transcript_16221/g.24328  ORF Transcript_16221/g.24328 Transcript_16221/m.24328 type:complete len:275 (-) Transcript_16221:354-1178(-)